MREIEGIGFRLLNADDEDGVRDVMKDALPREPLSMGVGVTVPDDTSFAFTILIPAVLNANLSFCAYDKKTGEIVGVRICLLARKDDPFLKKENPMFDINDPKTRKMAKIELVCKCLQDGINIFDKYHTDTFVHFYGLFVKERYGRRGIGLRLVEETLKYIGEQGYRYAWAEANSNYSQSIFRKLKFEEVAERKYDEIYENGEKMITHSTGVHKSTILCVKAL